VPRVPGCHLGLYVRFVACRRVPPHRYVQKAWRPIVTAESRTSIELRALTKLYGTRPNHGRTLLQQGMTREELARQGYVLALNDINLQVRSGEIYVVMGLSGSGKSTLIRGINRLVEPTAGQVFVEGHDICNTACHMNRPLV
jgi:ABC-type proline/glycine betaine transport system ATPase subunit